MMNWFWLALAVAMLTSAQDILNKAALRDLPAAVVVWGWWALSLPLLCLAWRPGFPAVPAGFWGMLAADTLLLTLGVGAYVKALQSDDLSVTVPLLSFTPLFLLLTAPLMLGEMPRPAGMTGVVCIVAGSYMLYLAPGRRHWFAPFRELVRRPGARYMLFVAAVFSVTANIDKIGVLRTSPYYWILLLNTSLSVSLSVILSRSLMRHHHLIRRHLGRLFIIGNCNALALLIQMTAIEQTQVPYLIAVKRMSILFSAVYGFVFLREPSWRSRLTGMSLMLAGVFLILLTGR